MAHGDIEWRAEKRRHMPEGVCDSYPFCKRLRDDWRKKCAYRRDRDNKRRQARRVEEDKVSGQCTVHECRNTALDGFRMCPQCRVYENAGVKRRNAKLKSEVMLAYGGHCSCCGEDESSFMSIDHINGYDGTGPRKSIPLYRWLKKNSYPEGFRVLCMNCNASRGFHGYCPHSVDGDKRSDILANKTIVQTRIEDARRKVFSAYGGAHCACCEEDAFEFLCIDHVDNDGAKHRREMRGNISSWLIKNEYPPGFQILCINCNFSKGSLGDCAHLRAGRN